MAFFLTPRFAPAYQHCGPFACAPSRPRHYSRTSSPAFIPFLSQVDGFLGELDRELRHAAHQQRQQRKRVFRARFDVKETKDAYEILGDVPGFEQENISIEVTDENNLRISGDTEQRSEQPAEAPLAIESEANQNDSAALNESEGSTTATAESDTESHKSYQPTVEDDFEDLGADSSSSTISTPTATAESKAKEKTGESVPAETSLQRQPQPEAPAQRQEPQSREWLSERIRGSFERTFQFPERIDMASVRASLKNGVLSVTVPKAPAFQTKRIAIQ